MCAACGLGQSCVAGACMATGSGGFSGGVSGTGGGTSGTGGGMTAGGMSGTGGGMTGGGMSGTGGGASGTGGGAGGPDCSIVGVQVPTGGCTLNLVAPTNCQVVSLANGFIELDWTTNTTFCEGPHKLYIAGSPVSTWTSGNVLVFSLTSGQYSNYAMTKNIGGYYLVTAQELARLQAVDGQYYFRVEGFYGSVSEVNTFIVR